MKSKVFKIANLIFATLVATFAIGNAFAWFIDSASVKTDFTGSSTQGYYASGDGTAERPYLITQPVHLYNFAWLQNNGVYNDDTVQYFALGADLAAANMEQFIIPPIGNAEYPFKDNFNGGGHTINGLKVSTNKRVLTKSKTTDLTNYKFSNYVGLFGATATGSEIKNFILNDPIIEVANETETSFVTTTYDTSETTKAVGLAVGQVNGMVQSVGVNKGKLLVRKAGYTTYNSILGELGEGISSSVTGGGKPTGNVGYGTSTDLKALYDTFGTTALSDGHAMPFKATSNALVPRTNKDVGVDLSTDPTDPPTLTPVSTSITQEAAAGNNIGYYVGSDIKFYNKSMTYKTYYTIDSNGAEQVYDGPDDSVKNYLNSNGSYLMRLSGLSSLAPNKLTEPGVFTVVENGRVGSYFGNVLLPVRCVWVAPIRAGTLKFVFASYESKSMGVRLLKLTRSKAKDYSTRFSKVETVIEWYNLQGKVPYYYETEVTQDDINAGYEYAVTASVDKSVPVYGSDTEQRPYIAYIDLGANGTADSGQVESDKISAVDFIYDDVEISQTDFNFVDSDGSSYTPTHASVYFLAAKYETILALYFVRSSTDPYTLTVQVDDMNATGTSGTSGSADGKVATNGSGTVTIEDKDLGVLNFVPQE